jgi:hypothetical protein
MGYNCWFFGLFSKTGLYFLAVSQSLFIRSIVYPVECTAKIKKLTVIRRNIMGGCDPVTFHNVNQGVFDCIKKKLSDACIPVPPGYCGRMQGLGVTADFNWDGTSNLTIRVIEKPWIVSSETVIEKISDFVRSCGGTEK